MKRISLWLAALACMGISLGCARHSEVADSTDYWPRVATALQASGGERERALAAQLFAIAEKPRQAVETGKDPLPISADGMRSRELVASLSESDDALALSVATQAAGALGDKAKVVVFTARWHALEPDNLAPLLLSGMPIDELLVTSRGATRYNGHAYAHIRLLSDAFKRVPMGRAELGPDGWKEYPTDELRAGVNAFAIWAAQAFPALRPLTDACRSDALEATPARRSDCLHVARALATQSDNLLMASVGISMLKRAAQTPEDRAMAAELSRKNAWQQQHYFQVLSAQGGTAGTESTLRLLRAPGIDTEEQLREATLRKHGIPLMPPSDWIEPDPG